MVWQVARAPVAASRPSSRGSMDAIADIAPVPSPAEVDQIAGHAEPTFRNLRITQGYHDLATAMARHLPGEANWCAFATWASRQAGRTIRREDLKHLLEAVLARSPLVTEVMPHIVEQLRPFGSSIDRSRAFRMILREIDLQRAVDRTSDAVARGNAKVFGEIARFFAAYLAVLEGDRASLTSGMTAFFGEFRPGDPPQGQRLLRSAFERYQAARAEQDAKRRSELILLANLEIALHEQVRAQPEIRDALDAAVPDEKEVAERLISAVAPHHATVISRGRRVWGRFLSGPTPLERALGTFLDQVRREVRAVITANLMTLTFSDGTSLHLGRDLHLDFPNALRTLENADLLAIMKIMDPTGDSLAGTGARDWGELTDRLHFITDLFRCYQHNPVLYRPPFTPNQVISIRAGSWPAGAL